MIAPRPVAAPSHTLAAYIARIFIVRFFLFLLLIVTILQALDLVNRSDDILAGDRQARDLLFSYILLRAPQLIDQFTPFAALLATLLSLSKLSGTSEITAMRAAGLSPHRILFPVGLCCAAIAGLHFLFQEQVTVPATRTLDYWEANDFARDLPPPANIRRDVWLSDEGLLINARRVSRTGSSGILLDDVTIYQRGDDGLLIVSIRADFATYQEGSGNAGWRLFDVERFFAADQTIRVAASERWPVSIDPERFLARQVRPEQTEIDELAATIKTAEEENLFVGGLRTWLFHRFTGPAASLLMPLMGSVAGFGLMRRGGTLKRVIVGLALGFSYFVAENFMLSMGELALVPAALAAGGALLLYLLVGFSILFYVEE